MISPPGEILLRQIDQAKNAFCAAENMILNIASFLNRPAASPLACPTAFKHRTEAHVYRRREGGCRREIISTLCYYPRRDNHTLSTHLGKKIIYIFRLESGAAHRFDVEFDRPTSDGELPAWTLLEADKCPHCPLPDTHGARCPAAADLVPIVEKFSALSSIERIDVHVLTPECESRKHTDTQTALRALMGLIFATGRCPILQRMRPLAHMHMPFATGTEMVYRIVSMHLLGRFLRGEPAALDGLKELFSDIDQLNRAFAGRLNRAAQRDASINALLALHSHSMLASMSIEPEMDKIRAWYRIATSANPNDTGSEPDART